MTDSFDSTWTPERMMRLRQVGHVRPSPDGRRVVFTVRQAVIEPERSEYRSQIHLADVPGAAPTRLSTGELFATDPRWSPDGRSIAFTSSHAGSNSVWVAGATGSQPQRLVDIPTTVSSFKWSPDGRWIAYTSPDAPKPEEERASVAKEDAWVVGRYPRMQRLYVVPVGPAPSDRRQPQPLTAGEYSVGVADIPSVYNWTPDSRTIVFTHCRTPSWEDWPSAGISVVDVETGTVRPLLRDNAAAIDPYVSPDGRWVACKVYSRPAWEWSSLVHLVPLDGGPARPLAATFDYRPEILGWSADGSRVFYRESSGTRARIGALPVEGGQPVILFEPDGLLTDVSLNRSGTALGFVLESPSTPPEAYVSRLEPWSPVQVSLTNEELVELPLGRTELIRWSSDDGLEIEGLLTLPVVPQAGQRHPLIVSVHGGPPSVSSQTFCGRPSIYGALAAFSERGYAVLRCNVRGSTGYGKAFRRANYRDWGGLDYRDLMAGIDHVIAMGVADPERLGILGWSYGGYLTAWAITQTQRFRAAVIGAGISNLVSYVGTTDSPGFTVSHFGGEVWEVAALLCARSPVLHVADVTAPVLILHGEEDERVPVTQGREFYNGLRRKGNEVEMVVYPRMGHVPGEPKFMRDVMQRTLDWMDRYVAKWPTERSSKDLHSTRRTASAG